VIEERNRRALQQVDSSSVPDALSTRARAHVGMSRGVIPALNKMGSATTVSVR
jgi:hypothetical protein